MEKLIASNGMFYTNGDAIAKTVFLANGDTAENWREITEAEAEQMRREQEEAAEKAYKASLEDFEMPLDAE